MSFDRTTLLLSISGEGVVLAFALRRKLWRGFPVFTGFIAWSLLSDLLATVLIHLPPRDYLRWYLDESVVDSLIRVALLIEIAWSVLRPILNKQKQTAILLLIGLAALTSLLIWPLTAKLSGSFLLEIPLLRITGDIQILNLVWLIGLILVSQALSLNWRDRALQIAAGLLVYSLAALGASFLEIHTVSLNSLHWLSRLVSLVYLAILGYWAVCFSMAKSPGA